LRGYKTVVRYGAPLIKAASKIPKKNRMGYMPSGLPAAAWSVATTPQITIAVLSHTLGRKTRMPAEIIRIGARSLLEVLVETYRCS